MPPFQIAFGDFGFLFAGLGSLIAVLHLLHRRHAQRVVSTLRFWQDENRTALSPRPRLEQPWSLLLHIFALALLILALTDLPAQRTHVQRHVLLLNTSASARNVFTAEKEQLRRYLKDLPPGDKFQLVAADGVAAPLTGFTSDSKEIEEALRLTRLSDTPLDSSVVSAYASAAVNAGPEAPGQQAYFGPSSTPLAASCSEPAHIVRVGVFSQRLPLWTAALRAMPGFAADDPRHADILLFDGTVPSLDEGRPAALFINPPAAVRIRPNDAVLRFDPLDPNARFDTRPAIALWHAMQQVAGNRSMLHTLPAGEIEWPLQPSEITSALAVRNAAGPVPFEIRDNSLIAYIDRGGLVTLHSSMQDTALCLATPLPAPSIGDAPRPLTRPGNLWNWRVFATLAALILVAEWWRYSRHTRALLLLKLAGIAAIVAALFGLALRMGNRPTALLVLVDQSLSIGDAARRQADEYLKQTAATSVTSFGAGSTDIESSLMKAVAHAPEGFAPRIRLLSDGRQTEGSALRAANALRRSGIPVDTVPLWGGEGAVQITSLSLPPNAFSGESFPVNASVNCSHDGHAELRLFAQGKEIGHSSLVCRTGANQVTMQARVRGQGAMIVSGSLGASALKQPIVIKTPQALYLTGDIGGDTDTNFVTALQKSGFTVSRSAADYSRFDLLVLNNIDLDMLPPLEQSKLESFVDSGGGLLVLSGEHQTYHDGKTLSTADRLVPALVKPPHTPDGISVVLVIDKSSSMEGRKIQLARLSASAVVDHLRPVDTIGILIFDNAYSWAAVPQRVSDKSTIKRLIAGIVPDGGTQIPTAVEEAYRRILTTKANYKHIVLLTDGISEEGDSLTLAQEAAAHQVTISTIGLGQDVNKPYLEKLADASGGQSYFLEDPERLRELLLKDIAKIEAKTAVESRIAVSPTEHAGSLLKDVDFAHAPALRGYIRYQARPGAQILLNLKDEHQDPLLAEWHYGLGKVAVFASDAKSRWAKDWIQWPGFDAFWSDVAFGLARRGSSGQFQASLNRSRQELLVKYLGLRAPAPCYYFGPKGAHGVLRWQPSGSGYQAKVSIPWSPGLWLVRPEMESDDFPETALLASDSEGPDDIVDRRLLQNLAGITGGLYNPAPGNVPPPQPHHPRIAPTWPALLWLAIVLMFLELAARKLMTSAASRPASTFIPVSPRSTLESVGHS